MLALSLIILACKDGELDDTGPSTSSGDDTALSDDTAVPVDLDGDGYTSDVDCDDDDAAVNPGVTEDCNGIDDDCDDAVDEELLEVYYPDADGDGFGDPDEPTELCEAEKGYTTDASDCQDTSSAVYPGADEVCNGIDDDCDELVDDDDDSLDTSTATTWYPDTDDDGFGVTDDAWVTCTVPQGYADHGEDCDDENDAVNPEAYEVCDDIDNDCDELIDDDDDTMDTSSAESWYADDDADGYGDATDATLACDEPSGYVADDTDCDDEAADVNPGQPEICSGQDDDCNGLVDDDDEGLDLSTASDWYVDDDGDGYGQDPKALTACDAGTGYGSEGGDCDDADSAVNPGAQEVCDDGTDNDCDGDADDADDSVDTSTGITVYTDGDGDGYGDDDSATFACSADSGEARDGGDCDDADADVNPGVQETCSGVDDDCDGLTDEDDDSLDVGSMTDWHDDADGDGYGDPDVFTEACDAPSGTVDEDTDCDDSDASVNPGAAEVEGDGTDQDCDGLDASYGVEDLVEGDLVINEIMQNPSVVADEDGEWFELYVAFSAGYVDLVGLVFADDATSSEGFEVADSLTVTAGDYVVFGTNTDTGTNGGATVDYDWGNTGRFSLANTSADGFSVELPDGTVLDEVDWNDGAMPEPTGASMNLDPSAVGTIDNDDPANWCETPTAVFGDGDRGTPGSANEACE